MTLCTVVKIVFHVWCCRVFVISEVFRGFFVVSVSSLLVTVYDAVRV